VFQFLEILTLADQIDTIVCQILATIDHHFQKVCEITFHLNQYKNLVIDVNVHQVQLHKIVEAHFFIVLFRFDVQIRYLHLLELRHHFFITIQNILDGLLDVIVNIIVIYIFVGQLQLNACSVCYQTIQNMLDILFDTVFLTQNKLDDQNLFFRIEQIDLVDLHLFLNDQLKIDLFVDSFEYEDHDFFEFGPIFIQIT